MIPSREVKSVVYNFIGNHHLEGKVVCDHSNENMMINGVLRRHLLLCIKECLNNVVKHSFASQVELKILTTEKEIIIKIHDNGRGFLLDENPTASSINGNGIKIINKRINVLKGKVVFGNENGAKVDIMIPLS